MVEGLWLDCLMMPSFKRETALATVMQFLEALLPKHFPVKEAGTPARVTNGGTV
jgi:hypothetical protein